MPIQFEAALENRDTWSVENCSVAMAMDAIGTRSSLLVLREAFYGTTRFDEFVRRTKSTEAIVAARLKQLTELGVFEKLPYKEEGKRTRYEYSLTPAGDELMPVVFSLMQWGSRHLQPRGNGPLRLVERGTGEPVVIGAKTEAGKGVGLDDVEIVAGGALAEQRA